MIDIDKLQEFTKKLREKGQLDQIDVAGETLEAIPVSFEYLGKFEQIAFGERAQLLRQGFSENVGQLVLNEVAELDEESLSVSGQTIDGKLAVWCLELLPCGLDMDQYNIRPRQKYKLVP